MKMSKEAFDEMNKEGERTMNNKNKDLVKSLESRICELKYLISTMKSRITTLETHVLELKE